MKSRPANKQNQKHKKPEAEPEGQRKPEQETAKGAGEPQKAGKKAENSLADEPLKRHNKYCGRNCGIRTDSTKTAGMKDGYRKEAGQPEAVFQL